MGCLSIYLSIYIYTRPRMTSQHVRTWTCLKMEYPNSNVSPFSLWNRRVETGKKTSNFRHTQISSPRTPRFQVLDVPHEQWLVWVVVGLIGKLPRRLTRPNARENVGISAETEPWKLTLWITFGNLLRCYGLDVLYIDDLQMIFMPTIHVKWLSIAMLNYRRMFSCRRPAAEG